MDAHYGRIELSIVGGQWEGGECEKDIGIVGVEEEEGV